MNREKSSEGVVLKSFLTLLAFTFTILTGYGVVLGSQDDVALTTVIVMRHAEKVSPEGDPNLSQEGKERAHHLKQVLGWLPISAVYSTKTKRTIQTAEPLAKCHEIPITFYKTLPEMLERIRSDDLRGKTVIVMGHMGTAQELIDSLGGKGSACPGLSHDEICIAQITPDNRVRVLRLKYGKTLEPVKCKQP